MEFQKYKNLIFSLSIIGLSYFLFAMICLHFLDRDFDPLKNFISEYSGGKYYWLSQSAFWVLCSCFFLVTIGLILEFRRIPLALVPFVLFCIAFISLGVLSAYPIDWSIEGARENVLIHNKAANTGFLTIIAGQVFWPLIFFFHSSWRRVALPMLMIGLVTLSYLLIQGIHDLNHWRGAQVGLHQRILVAFIWIWTWVCTLQFKRFDIVRKKDIIRSAF